MIVDPISANAFSVVIVGAWNPAIFSPEWAKEFLAHDKTRDVVLAIPMPMPMANLPTRLTVDGINLYASKDALMVDCVEYNEVFIDVCASKFQQLSELLPHTPVNAVGVNFKFLGTLDDSPSLADLFTFSDAGMIDSTQYALSESLIKRTYKLQNATTLNLSLSTFSDTLRIEFNFHTDVRRMSEIAVKTTAEQIRMARGQAIQFLQDVYSIELDT